MAPLQQRRTALGLPAHDRMRGSVDLPRTRIDRSTQFAWLYVLVTGTTGVALFAVSSALGAVGWMFADVPGAQNDFLRAAMVALVGVAFGGLSIAGRATLRRLPVAVPTRSAWRTAAVVLSATGFAVAVWGSSRFSAHSVANQLRPVLDDASDLNSTGGSNGIVILLVAVALSGAGLVALTLGRAPAPARRRPAR